MREQTQFPLIADHEFVIENNPQMNLYEECDLISNIKGNYQDKVYDIQTEQVSSVSISPLQTEEDLLPPLFASTSSHYSRKNRKQPQLAPTAHQKTPGQLAREYAREDLKKKRSAPYLRDERTPLVKPRSPKEVRIPVVHEEARSLTRLSAKLQQETYILADLPPVYSLKMEDRQQEKQSRSHSFDFLKKSQVYNYPERKVQQERRIAQELNLTHLEED